MSMANDKCMWFVGVFLDYIKDISEVNVHNHIFLLMSLSSYNLNISPKKVQIIGSNNGFYK